MKNTRQFIGILVLLGSFYSWQTTSAMALVPTARITVPPPTTTTLNTTTPTITPIKVETEMIRITEVNKLDPQPEPPSEINKLDPQPEPPAEINRLDPQPEPPMTTGIIQNDIKAIAPVLSAVKEFKQENATDSKGAAQKIMLFESPSGTGNEIEILPNVNSLVARFEHNNNKINIPVKTDFKVEEGKMVLDDGTATYTLKMQLPAFYSSLNTALEKIGLASNTLKNVELTIQEHKPIYNVTVEERGKLFGLIPLKVKNNVRINDDGTEIKTERPWYTMFFTGLMDLTKIKFAPNITVSKLEIVPADFKAGDTVKVKATLTNTGNSYALSMPGFSGAGSTLVFYTNNEYLGGYAVPIALEAGTSVEYDYTWKSTICNAPLRVEFTTSKIDETNSADNILTATAICK